MEKFLFDVRFDRQEPLVSPEEEGTALNPETVEEPEKPELPPPPTFSEEELQAVREAAFQQGVEVGVQQGRLEASQTQQQFFIAVLEALSHRLTLLLSEESTRVAQSREMTLQIALAIARKLLPHYTTHHGLEEIINAVQQVLLGIGETPRLMVRVHPNHVDAIALRLQELVGQHGITSKVVVVPDMSLGDADCLIEWSDGGLERDTMRIWRNIDKLAAEVLQGAHIARHVEHDQRSADTLSFAAGQSIESEKGLSLSEHAPQSQRSSQMQTFTPQIDTEMKNVDRKTHESE